MGDLAMKLEALSVIQEYGTVVAAGENVKVRSASGVRSANVAASCLLQPALGDRVLTAAERGGECYVLAVLKRTHAIANAIRFTGDTSLIVDGGRLRTSARDGVEVATAGEIALNAGSIAMNALAADVAVERLSFAGTLLQAGIEKIKLVAGTFDSVLERFYQRVARSIRRVDEIDQVKAGQIDYEAEKNLALHAKYTLVTAEELVKMDGEQIHVG
ncbi:MAG: DUF3540 domain-containing protein [Betaproteobacteria bacterium]|nr:DUF3540 domain-containing protein [Betaproteobacteria bacterium]MBI3937450.1 DUF3540 domain-containing protein [Betaproteobacteria bacterium]